MPISSPDKSLTAIRTKIILFLLLIFSFTLRALYLDTNPAGFFCDEASIGYNAYRILISGTDEFGKSLPLFFEAFGEYKNPLQIYSAVPFIAFFGLNETATRLPSAVYGVGSIVLLYLLVARLTSKKTALIASFFLAISPWHLHFSRISFEGLTAFVFFTLLSLCFFVSSQKNNNYLPVSYFLFGVTCYTYFPTRIFTPLIAFFLLLYLLITKKEPLVKLLFSGLLFLVVISPLLLQLFLGTGQARWNQVSVFSKLPLNKAVMKITISYFNHFSPLFLFTKGDIDFPGQFITRHSIRGIGEFYPYQAVLLILGLFVLIGKKQYSILYLLVLCLLIYPLSSAVTINLTPQATRSVIGVIPFTVLMAIGLGYIIDKLGKKSLLSYLTTFLILFIVLFSFYNFLKLWTAYPLYSTDFWGFQYGAKEIVGYFEEVEPDYDELFMEPKFNGPDIFFKFYAPDSCKNCFLGTLRNFNKNKKQLFALSKESLEDYPNLKYETKKEIFYPDGNLAFKILEVKSR